MLLLVYTLIKASSIGWGNTRTIGELAVAVGLLVAFVFNELRHRNPLAPLSIFRINGLGCSNVTQLIAAGGMYWLSRSPGHGSYRHDLLWGLLVLSIGFGPVFVGVTTAAGAGVPADKAGLARVAAQRLPAARRRARAGDLHRAGHRPHPPPAGGNTPPAPALTAGFQRALLVGAVFILVSAILALRATDTRGETDPAPAGGEAEPLRSAYALGGVLFRRRMRRGGSARTRALLLHSRRAPGPPPARDQPRPPPSGGDGRPA